MSYNGGVDFGLLGDYDALPDIEKFGEFIEQSLDELLDVAEKSAPAARKPARGARPLAKRRREARSRSRSDS